MCYTGLVYNSPVVLIPSVSGCCTYGQSIILYGMIWSTFWVAYATVVLGRTTRCTTLYIAYSVWYFDRRCAQSFTISISSSIGYDVVSRDALWTVSVSSNICEFDGYCDSCVCVWTVSNFTQRLNEAVSVSSVSFFLSCVHTPLFVCFQLKSNII